MLCGWPIAVCFLALSRRMAMRSDGARVTMTATAMMTGRAMAMATAMGEGDNDATNYSDGDDGDDGGDG